MFLRARRTISACAKIPLMEVPLSKVSLATSSWTLAGTLTCSCVLCDKLPRVASTVIGNMPTAADADTENATD